MPAEGWSSSSPPHSLPISGTVPAPPHHRPQSTRYRSVVHLSTTCVPQCECATRSAPKHRCVRGTNITKSSSHETRAQTWLQVQCTYGCHPTVHMERTAAATDTHHSCDACSCNKDTRLLHCVTPKMGVLTQQHRRMLYLLPTPLTRHT